MSLAFFLQKRKKLYFEFITYVKIKFIFTLYRRHVIFIELKNVVRVLFFIVVLVTFKAH